MASTNRNAKVDAYIDRARPFAIPILVHLRSLVHQGCPDVEETIRWGRPFFAYRGAILANMSAFKEHCSFGFWGEEIGAVLAEAKVLQAGAMGSLGRVTQLKDLPPNQQMLGWVRQATAFVESGQYTSPIAARRKVVKAPRQASEIPEEFSAALKKHCQAGTIFAAFSPSCQREYIQWIAEAKRPETRDKRISSAVAWIAEGKQRNWKYQDC